MAVKYKLGRSPSPILPEPSLRHDAGDGWCEVCRMRRNTHEFTYEFHCILSPPLTPPRAGEGNSTSILGGTGYRLTIVIPLDGQRHH